MSLSPAGWIIVMVSSPAFQRRPLDSCSSSGTLLPGYWLEPDNLSISHQSSGPYTGCHESGYHSLKLHITHGLHLPSCTALTHSHPPLHQSHSCHHSLINPDCLTTPAPHSLTHIKAAHKHSLTAKSCSCLGWHFWALFILLSVISVFDPGLPDLGTLNLCLWPRPLPGIVYVSALPLIFLFLPADHCLLDSV